MSDRFYGVNEAIRGGVHEGAATRDLSDLDFKEWYLDRRRKDWNQNPKGETPVCHGCKQPISDSDELRLMWGRALDPQCFGKELAEYVGESFVSDEDREYFERVERILGN